MTHYLAAAHAVNVPTFGTATIIAFLVGVVVGMLIRGKFG